MPARRLCLCRACATSSLPLPDSPSIRTREWRVGELQQLFAQLLHRRAVAEQSRSICAGFRRGDLERLPEQGFELRRFGRLGDEVDGAQRARVPGVGFIVLSGQHDDLDARRDRDQFGDELETLIGAVRPRRQAEVDQSKRRRRIALPQQRLGMRPRLRGGYVEFFTEHIAQRVGDDGVVIDDQQVRFSGFGHVAVPLWGYL